MSYIDVIIIIAILLGGVVGFKQGVIKKTTSFLGLFVIVILSFILKNEISFFFYEYLPFFNFGGLIKGVEVVNVLIYEVVAFFVVFTILSLILKMLLVITGLIEKILQATLLLSIPSKILGIFVGLIEGYVYVFLGLFILTIPIFNVIKLDESELAKTILKETPVLSSFTERTTDTYTSVYDLLKEKDDKTNKELNEEILVILIDNQVITKDSAQRLINKNKISVTNKDFLK